MYSKMVEKLNTKFNIDKLILTVVFFLYFTFSYMSSMIIFIFRRHFIVVAFLIFIFGVAVLLFLSSSRMKIDKYILAWFAIFLISLIRNGDIQQGNFEPSLYFLAGIFVPLLLKKYPIERIGYKIIGFYSLIHVFFGFFFLVFPNILKGNIDAFYEVTDVFYDKLLYHINSGYMVGITTHYSTEGMYMAFAFVLAASALLYAMNVKDSKRINGFVFSAVFLIGLFLTGKRAQLVFAAIAICIVYFLANVFGNYSRRIKKFLVFLFIIIILLVICLNIPAFSSTIARFAIGGDFDTFSSSRVSTLWIPALEQFADNPIFGIGWRHFKWDFPQRQGVFYVNNDVHCVYLQLLCEGGILFGGFVLFVMIWTYILSIKNLLYLKRRRSFTDTYKYLMISVGFQTFFLLYCVTGNPLYDIQCFYPYLFSCAVAYKYDLNLKRNTE